MTSDETLSRAFVLGAGRGTRLRPFTDNLPKPLIPVWNVPLITYAFDHAIHDLAVEHFMVNTHHAADRFFGAFPAGSYRGLPVTFRHEPELLDTAGGLDNIRDLLEPGEDFLVYNGDILTDLPLGPALRAHREAGDLVTLLLRSGGGNVTWEPESRRILDLRNALGTNAKRMFQFTGIYLVSWEFLSFLEPGKVESVVLPFLRAIESDGRVGGFLVDEGVWSDLGDPEAYRRSIEILADDAFPRYGKGAGQCRIHPDAVIDPAAEVDEFSTIGAGAKVGPEARVIASIIWAGATVAPGAVVREKILR